ncbi:hypothetical protein C5167_043334 [Papaver somniferum]|uniref:PGG domain-containing protein n=1 Tax=Papaver somniferum TaxID=3469 RepID=A0A4Y7L9B3_PAPSO|nr:uncharacterized protein LOC113318135 [Papaver somniferum]RZC80755.1 hypothetical protein C5167_043334 [Papaver somniferum]
MAPELSLLPSTMSQESELPTENIVALKKRMFKQAMAGLWEDVVANYANPLAQEITITKSGDTLLHVAVSDGQVETVQKLIDLISNENLLRVLKIGNHRGNTPLHLAATSGSVEMCEAIAEKSCCLIGVRNYDSETPLFLAALHGKKQAFLSLHAFCEHSDYSYCRRNDGETILHCAIRGEYFDLAFRIIGLYEHLVDNNNEKGHSPLHLLALNPSAFKSGSRLARFDLILYYCIIVDQLTPNKSYNYISQRNVASRDSCPTYRKYCPENYRTCLTLFKFFKQLILVIVSRKQVRDSHKGDTENPHQMQQKSSSRTLSEQQNDEQKIEIKKNKRFLSYGALDPRHHLYPPNYTTCFNFFKLAMKALSIFLGLGFIRVRKIKEKKEKHTWAAQVMEELVERASVWEYENNGVDPHRPFTDEETTAFDAVATAHTVRYNDASSSDSGDRIARKKKARKRRGIVETPILIAAKMGVTEMVEKILDKFPVAIQDINWERKNVVLLAVENRQPHVYRLLLKRKILLESVFRKLDNKGNSALHLAATLGEYRPWLIPGAALQMQWEIRWYKFVKESMPRNFFVRHNNRGKSPKQVFTETHSELVKEGGAWLTSTSESCSVVAALIATVAFATASTVPGGVQSNTGAPTLEKEPAFNVFAISSLVALCFSVTSVIMFLSILTSRYQEQDFASDLPKKLIVGLSSLFISIASMLVSFCAGHFFILKDKLRYAAYPLYATTCLPVAFFAAAQFPLYFDLIRATFRKVPQRSYKVNVAI